MEPNNVDQNVNVVPQPEIKVADSLPINNVVEPKKNKLSIPLITGIAVIVLVVGGFFLYKYVYIPKHEAQLILEAQKAKEAQILALQDKITKAGDSPVSLTEADYDLLLSQNIPNPDIKGLKATVNGTTISFNKEDKYFTKVAVAFPYIPNITGDKKVFIRLDSVIASDGTDILKKDYENENDNDMFTEVNVEKRASGNMSYLVGERDAHLIDNDIEDNSGIKEIKGKVIIRLPINTQNITLGPSDKGIEKKFVGGFITLDDIDLEKGSALFTFTGNKDYLEYPLAYNKNGDLVSYNSYYHGDQNEIDFSDSPITSVLFRGAESIVMREIPFTITNTGAKPLPVLSEVTDSEKELAIKAYMDFGKVLDSGDFVKLSEYFKKSQPEMTNTIEEQSSASTPAEKKQIFSAIKTAFYFNGNISSDVFHSSSAVWTKADDKISVKVKTKGKIEGLTSTQTINFTKNGEVWFVNMGLSPNTDKTN
ncbi:MAG: hypothetical protein WCI41_03350 [bacterium]